MRTIQRIIRRSELPAEYSKGFNPHMILSIAQPLAVGVYSRGEYMDVHFQEELDESYIKEKLNEASTPTIEFLDVVKIDENDRKVPQAMAVIDAAKYTLKLKCLESNKVEYGFKELLKLDQWTTIKETKKDKKEVDIKPLIKEINYKLEDNILTISTILDCGSKSNLSAQLLGEYIRDNVDGINKDTFINIEREEMFAYRGKELLPLSEYLK
jgi:radical SAM-linked protein